MQNLSGRGARDYLIPEFLVKQGFSQQIYGSWLDKVTVSITRRDRKRLEPEEVKLEIIRRAVHTAVCNGGDRDFYTGETLDWKLLQHFNLDPTQASKAYHSRVPSVDHFVLSATNPVFRICSLRTNKCKSDYSLQELETFCNKFLIHQNAKEI